MITTSKGLLLFYFPVWVVYKLNIAWVRAVVNLFFIYIEPDVEYIETYTVRGGVFNCADAGKCGYTTRPELAYAYANMLIESQHNGKTYNLHGEALTQYELVAYLNIAFGTNLIYEPLTVEEYLHERVAELGEFMGNIISGIYQGIREGKSNNTSHFLEAAGRDHQTWKTYFESIKKSRGGRTS